MVINPDDSVALNTKSLVFGADIGTQLASPVSCALCTWFDSNFPLEVGPSSRCLTKVYSALPITVAHEFVSDSASLLLSALPTAVSPPTIGNASPPPEIGNVNTFLDPGYSPKDLAKLQALAHLRAFFSLGNTPSDTRLAPVVRSLLSGSLALPPLCR